MLPSTIIKEIEKLLKGFLWNAGGSAIGKARLAWKMVCRPKDQGGLGIKDMKKWNEVLLIRQFWKILEDTISLWAKWVNVVKLKNRSIWEIEEDKYDSWGWKTLLSIRGLVKQNVFCRIGDGRKASMWYDQWCSEGPLSKFINKRILYDARLQNDIKVGDMVSNGKWLWPEGWEERFSILKSISTPVMQNNKEDRIMWITNNEQHVEFSTKQAWKDLRRNWPKVEWKDVVWFKQFNPRHAFILWLAIHGKLMTQDRIAKWQNVGCMQCALCNSGRDSHEHIFFQCKFSQEVWTNLGSFMWGMGCMNNLQDIVHEMAKKKAKNNIGIVVNKLLLAAAIYFLWQERNLRTFQKKERNVEAVCRIIKENVKNKLLSIRLRMTRNVLSVGAQWNLKWTNNNFVVN